MTEEEKPKRVITRETYLQAVGLMALAMQHRKTVEQCVEALGKTLGEVQSRGGYYDVVNDEVYSGSGSVDLLLEQLNLEVVE